MDLKRQFDLIKSVNRGGYHRCGICGTVSNQKIETNLGDFKDNLSFVNDPKDSLHFICLGCEEVIEDLRQDYEYMDSMKEI